MSAEEDRALLEQYAAVEQTMDQKLADLLRKTAAIAAHDAADKAKQKYRAVLAVVLTLVLGGLISMQVQLWANERSDDAALRDACSTRNRQAEAVVSFIERARAQSQTVEAQKAYERFLREFGPVPDCDRF